MSFSSEKHFVMNECVSKYPGYSEVVGISQLCFTRVNIYVMTLCLPLQRKYPPYLLLLEQK